MINYKPFKNGRRYKVFIESDNTLIKITTSDIKGVVLSGNSLKFPLGFHIMEVLTDVNTVSGGSATTFGTRKVYGDGCQAIEIPSANNFDYANLYVYGYRK